jgi:uncharacterized protein YdaT
MPWTSERYPASMKRLHPLVRGKAIEIANALLEEGHPEGRAIRIAIARAREWAGRLGLHDDDSHDAGRATAVP